MRGFIFSLICLVLSSCSVRYYSEVDWRFYDRGDIRTDSLILERSVRVRMNGAWREYERVVRNPNLD